MAEIKLRPLQAEDRAQFVLDNQAAFRYGAMEEFGLRDNHFEEPGEIISKCTIECSIDHGEAYRIWKNNRCVGGLVLKIVGETGELELLFVAPEEHSKGIGYAAWCAVEEMYPQVSLWITHTPYFEKRNIHFYVNRCGFHITAFYHEGFPGPHCTSGDTDNDLDGMFRFEKRITI